MVGFGFLEKTIILGRYNLIRQTLQKKKRGGTGAGERRRRRERRREKRKRRRRGALLFDLKEENHPGLEKGWKKAQMVSVLSERSA